MQMALLRLSEAGAAAAYGAIIGIKRFDHQRQKYVSRVAPHVNIFFGVEKNSSGSEVACREALSISFSDWIELSIDSYPPRRLGGRCYNASFKRMAKTERVLPGRHFDVLWHYRKPLHR